MPFLRRLIILLAGILSLSANPFLEAEQSFLQQLNSIPGIELGGGPFHTSEQHHFDGESGYFVLAPKVSIPTLDQRLTVQTRSIDLPPDPADPTHSLPLATGPFAHDDSFDSIERQQIFATLAATGLALRRDEITAFNTTNIQIRPVLHLPIVKLTCPAPTGTNSKPTATNLVEQPKRTAEVLLGFQPWLGIPGYRATFRHHDDLNLWSVQNGLAIQRASEVPRHHPFLSPQSFFAEPGLPREQWQKVLQNFAAISLPTTEILEASVSDVSVILSLDIDRTTLPQQWVKLEKNGSSWKVVQAVEFRAEFPRPPAWWSFLPLLPEQQTSRDVSANSKIPFETRHEITTLVNRLRGVGEIIDMDSTDSHQTILVRTSFQPQHSYKILFTRHQDRWRFFSIYYSLDR